jgi:acyl dehydratase
MSMGGPVPHRYLEDFAVGDVYEAGSVQVTEAEIIEFARRYDPQRFHIDAEAARQSPYAGLIASGWHTIALSMRLLVDSIFGDSAGLGSPGVDEIRWPHPVRPGDTLTVRMTVLDSRPSRSKPDRGIMRFRVEVANQDGETVMTMQGVGLVGRRPVT